MVPDKIYIRTGMSGLLYGSKGKSFESDVEYIRKEALLEWAKDKLLDCEISNDETDYGRIEAYQNVIDKLNEM